MRKNHCNEKIYASSGHGSFNPRTEHVNGSVRSSESDSRNSGLLPKWIHAAEPEFPRKLFDLDNYTISVIEHEESVTVILSCVDAPDGARGSVGGIQDMRWRSA